MYIVVILSMTFLGIFAWMGNAIGPFAPRPEWNNFQTAALFGTVGCIFGVLLSLFGKLMIWAFKNKP